MALVVLTVHLDLVAHRVQWVPLDQEDFLVRLEAREREGRPVPVDPKAHRVRVARVGHRDLLDQLELLETLAQMDRLGPKVLLVVLVSVVLRVFLALKDLRDPKETSVFQDLKANKVDPVNGASRVIMDPKDLLEYQVCKDCKAHLEKKASVVRVVKLVHKEHQVPQVFVGRPVAVVSLGPTDPLERKASVVQGESMEWLVPRDQLEILAALENLVCREQGV